MSWTNQKYINFRQSSGFVTDNASSPWETYDLGATSRTPTLDGDSLSFGWSVDLTGQSRDRNNANDRRCAGIVFTPNSNGAVTWSFTLPAGTYDIRLALGDGGGGQTIYCRIFDGASLVATVASGASTGTNQFIDANGNLRTSDVLWASGNTARSVVISSGTLVIEIGNPAASGPDSSTLACVGILQTAAGGNTSITPGSGSLSLSGQTPNVLGSNIKPATAALTLSGLAATVTQQLLRQPGSGALTLSGLTPLLSFIGLIKPNAGSLTLNGLAPQVSLLHNRQPGSGSLTLTGQIPSIATPGTITPTSGSLTLLGYVAPQTLTVPSPAAAALTITGQTPIRILGAIRAPGVGSLALSSAAPQVTLDFNRTPGAGSLVLTGYAPAGSGSFVIKPAAAALAFTGQVPFVQGALTIQPPTSNLTLSGFAPVLSGANILRPPVGSLSLTGGTAVVIAGLVRQPGSGALVLTGIASVVRVPIFITPPTGALILSGQLSPSAGNGGAGSRNVLLPHPVRYGLLSPLRNPLRVF